MIICWDLIYHKDLLAFYNRINIKNISYCLINEYVANKSDFHGLSIIIEYER